MRLRLHNKKANNVIQKIFGYFKGLPLRRIALVMLIIIVSILLMFHFYFASPARITSIFRNDISQLNSVKEAIAKADESFASTATPTQHNESIATLNDLVADTKEVSLPPRIFSTYAFRGENGNVKATLNNLYTANSNNKIDQTDVTLAINSLIATTELADELLNKQQISKDTNEYIKFLESSTTTIQGYDDSSNILDLSEVTDILFLTQQAAEEYADNQDITKFNYRYSNLSSELYKEIINSWDQAINNDYQNYINTQIDGRKAILDALQ